MRKEIEGIVCCDDGSKDKVEPRLERLENVERTKRI